MANSSMLDFAEQHRAGLGQAAGDGAVFDRDEVLEDLRAGRGADAAGGQDVLEDHRDAEQRRQRRPRRGAASAARACASACSRVTVSRLRTVDVVEGFDAVEVGARRPPAPRPRGVRAARRSSRMRARR